MGGKNLPVKNPQSSQSFICSILLISKGKSLGGGQVFSVTLNDTTPQTAFIYCPGAGNRAQPSEAGQEHHSSASPTSQSTALLIILVILNEASQTLSISPKTGLGRSCSRGPSKWQRSGSVPITKSCNTSRARRQRGSLLSRAKSEQICSWPWRKHHVRTCSDPKHPLKSPKGSP